MKQRDLAYGSAGRKDLLFAPLQGMDVTAWGLREEVEEERWKQHIHDTMTNKLVIRVERHRHHLDKGYPAEFMEPDHDGQSRLANPVVERSCSLRGFFDSKC